MGTLVNIAAAAAVLSTFINVYFRLKPHWVIPAACGCIWVFCGCAVVASDRLYAGFAFFTAATLSFLMAAYAEAKK